MIERGVITTDFILVPGAGGVATPFWRLVSAQLHELGHRALPVDLPGEAPDVGLPEYAALIAEAIESSARPVVVAQSMGGFSAVMACARVPVRWLVLVNAMVPIPGETPGEWWTATGAVDARVAAALAGGYDTEFDVATYFLHDLGTEDAAAVLANPGDEADVAFGQPCDVEKWPDVPTAAIIGRDDRLFPCEFQRQLLRDRAGVEEPTIIPGGHLLALANPDGLFEALINLASP
jgi:pimeloyl-ACP methyl ester carboxylesterase